MYEHLNCEYSNFSKETKKKERQSLHNNNAKERYRQNSKWSFSESWCRAKKVQKLMYVCIPFSQMFNRAGVDNKNNLWKQTKKKKNKKPNDIQLRRSGEEQKNFYKRTLYEFRRNKSNRKTKQSICCPRHPMMRTSLLSSWPSMMMTTTIKTNEMFFLGGEQKNTGEDL